MTGIVLGLAALLGYPMMLALVAMMSVMPDVVGQGIVAQCGDVAKCVSSTETRSNQYVAPLTYADDPAIAQVRLRLILESMPRTVIVSDIEGYIHAEHRSPFLRFVDDLEFRIEADGMVQVRSAARLSGSMSNPRQWVEIIRAAFSS